MKFPSHLPLVVASLLLAPGAPAHGLDAPAAGVAADGTISIAVKDADLSEVLRLFARIGQKNLVLDPSVRGKTITMTLDSVPWEQAMDVVLSSQGLASASEGNVVRVAPVGALISEERQRAGLREAREQAGELRTIAVPLSNADAMQTEALVRKGLSPRGSTAVDKRTNTLFITDVFPGGPDGSGLSQLSPISPSAAPAPQAASYDIRLLDVTGLLPSELASMTSLAGARTVASARVVLGLGQRAPLSLGDREGGSAVTMALSPQRDGNRTVLVVRGARSGAEGTPIARAVNVGSAEAIALPSAPDDSRSLMLVLLPV